MYFGASKILDLENSKKKVPRFDRQNPWAGKHLGESDSIDIPNFTTFCEGCNGSIILWGSLTVSSYLSKDMVINTDNLNSGFTIPTNQFSEAGMWLGSGIGAAIGELISGVSFDKSKSP
ncbi:MAG: hypothetical protein SGJ02_04360 [bacterium]|nr:hypothetical protein [bacterium]